MGKVIFRKIGGRIVPIRIGSRDITMGYNKERVFEAKTPRKTVGRMHVTFPAGTNRISVKDVQVVERYRGKGISSELFKHVHDFGARIGKRFIRTSEIIHPAQVEIRAKYKTKFIADGLGKYEELSKVITQEHARKLLSTVRQHRINVRATTLISWIRKKRG